MERNHVPVIFHCQNYRGDHSADVRKILFFPETATVADLMAKVKAEAGSWIEVTEVEKVVSP